jgi:hypothetical protein
MWTKYGDLGFGEDLDTLVHSQLSIKMNHLTHVLFLDALALGIYPSAFAM